MKLPELLAPAGNFEKLRTALHYGADSVYLGLSDFSLRARADNFDEAALKKAVDFVHHQGKKIYVTINIFPHNRDISLIREHLAFLKTLPPDAIILSDVGVFELATTIAEEIPLHISTQANITNHQSAAFWERLGAKRLVLSRELTIHEIREIRQQINIELECFVHGALCISYSGRCYMSSFIANRSGNRGECTNACRWNYTLMEQQRPGEHFPVYENDRGTYVMSSRDLCMIEHLDTLSEAGVNSFKIEGRMKGINYVAGVVKTYREAVDSLHEKPYKVKKQWLQELEMFSSRGFTTGMFLGQQDDQGYNHDEREAYRKSHELVGVVKSVSKGRAVVALRNNLNIGDALEFLSPGLEHEICSVSEIHNMEGSPVPSGRNDEEVVISIISGVRENDLIRRSIRPGSSR